MSYSTLHGALKSLVPDAESVDWREAAKLGYTHDLIQVYHSELYDRHIIALANAKGKHRASIAGHILSAAVTNGDLLFFADKWQGYTPIGLIKAGDYDKKCGKVEVIFKGDRFTDAEVGILSKATIADYVLHQDTILDAQAHCDGFPTFMEATRWLGLSKRFDNPTARILAEVADKWEFDVHYTALGWKTVPRK